MNVPAVQPVCFLFDNGSIRADSTRMLRGVAAALAARLGVEVRPVSLLHSTNVPADKLDGVPAELLEPALMEHLARRSEQPVVLLPLFFGPSGALTEYVPARMKAVQTRHPEARLMLGRWLVDPERDAADEITAILADRVRQAADTLGAARPKVVLVDHGSPQQGVAAVRNHLGERLRAALGGAVETVAVASMERREGAEYDFSDPLLAVRLRTPPFDRGDVVVALQFLMPGRHAGAGGDIAEICEEAMKERPGLRITITSTIADDRRLLGVLERRYREALTRLPGDLR